jgi:hypothetical protein
MHRSGTSLLASIVQQAGVRIGERLLPANWGNPRGYFEDMDFLNLHDRMLSRCGQGVYVQDLSLLGSTHEEDRRQAEQLVSERRSHGLWGWKDPRTALFLSFWEELLDQAHYLLVYRHPLDVVLSLRRRQADVEILADPMIALQTWKVHNRSILDLYRRCPQRCVLCDIEAVVEDISGFSELLGSKLGLHIDPHLAEELVAPSELIRVRRSQKLDDCLHLIDRSAWDLLADLKAEADLPALRPSETTAPYDTELQRLLAPIEHWMADEALQDDVSGPVLALIQALVYPEPISAHRQRDILLRSCVEARSERESLRERLIKLQAEYDERTTWALRLEKNSKDLEARVLELQAELDNRTNELEARTGWALQLDTEIKELGSRVLKLQAELEDQSRS